MENLQRIQEQNLKTGRRNFLAPFQISRACKRQKQIQMIVMDKLGANKT